MNIHRLRSGYLATLAVMMTALPVHSQDKSVEAANQELAKEKSALLRTPTSRQSNRGAPRGAFALPDTHAVHGLEIRERAAGKGLKLAAARPGYRWLTLPSPH